MPHHGDWVGDLRRLRLASDASATLGTILPNIVDTGYEASPVSRRESDEEATNPKASSRRVCRGQRRHASCIVMKKYVQITKTYLTSHTAENLPSFT
jgi:hypothetical protein